MKIPHKERLFRRLYGRTALRDHLPLVPRNTVMVIVESFNDYRFLLLEPYEQPGEYAFVTGDCGELPTQETAIAKVRSETGYWCMLPPRKLGPVHEAFFDHARGQNQFSHHLVYFCRLTDDTPLFEEKHRRVWVRKCQVLDKLTVPSHRIAWRALFLKEA